MSHFVEPNSYRASGRVRWLVFLPGVALALATAVLMAWCLHLLFEAGYYFLLIAPLIASFPVAGILYAAVSLGHCRNRMVAGAAAVLAALVLSVGRFYFDMVADIGWANAARVDLLPHYLNFRMQTDVLIHGAGAPPVQRARNTMDIIFNWFFLAMDTGAVGVVLVAAGVTRAGRVYIEERGKWTRKETASCAAGVGPLAVDALARGQATDLPPLEPVSNPQKEACTELTFEYLPPDVAGGPLGPGYLTIKELGVPKGRHNRRTSKTLARQWELDPVGVKHFAPLFPGLRMLLSVMPSPGTTASHPAAQAAAAPRAYATIEPVPEPYRGTVHTRRVLLTATFIGLLPLVLAIGIAAALGIYAAVQWDNLPPAAASGLIATAAVVLVSVFWFLLRYADFLPSRYELWLLKRALGQRLDPWVDYREPDTIYIQVIPKANWGKVMLNNATDVGFMRLDLSRRELLFEGDQERWHIPASALVSCDVESYFVGDQPNNTTTYYVAVLRARTPMGDWEAPISCPHIRFRKRTGKEREEEAYGLQAAIDELMPQTPVAQEAPIGPAH